MDGKIFNIQRFSIYDGPGIRTTVFFKGCNLRCLWCHNPESQSSENELMFFENKCISCGKCTELCNNTFTDKCTACGKCADICEHGARKIYGQTVSSDEVVNKALKDKLFYETSGGGITLSGGEPLLQPAFALDILKKCKENGINTTIETAGNVKWSIFEDLLPFTDYLMFDIKCINKDNHKMLTGVGNEQILSNAEKLKNYAKNLIFRMPVIPSLNDDEVRYVVDFADNIKVELMAYHTTGCSKYKSLDRNYLIPDIKAPDNAYMISLAQKNGALYEPTGLN